MNGALIGESMDTLIFLGMRLKTVVLASRFIQQDQRVVTVQWLIAIRV